MPIICSFFGIYIRITSPTMPRLERPVGSDPAGHFTARDPGGHGRASCRGLGCQ
jgi:hypothetical protein